jgi:biopolymer transport protein TolR
MGMSTNGGNRRSVMSEINVTPMVDVMLVLLIIFMITTPLLDQGIPLDLPQTQTTSLDPTEVQMVIEITKNKDIFMDKEKLSLKTLEAHLLKALKGSKRREVFVRADKIVPYGYVAQVMAVVRASGITRLGLVTEPLP